MKIYVSILHSALKVFSIAATCTNSRHSIFITAPLNVIFTFSLHIPTERVKESKNQPIADTHSLTHQQMDAIVLDDGILFTKNMYIWMYRALRPHRRKQFKCSLPKYSLSVRICVFVCETVSGVKVLVFRPKMKRFFLNVSLLLLSLSIYSLCINHDLMNFSMRVMYIVRCRCHFNSQCLHVSMIARQARQKKCFAIK